MLTVEEAQHRVLRRPLVLATESVELMNALNRTLSEDIRSEVPMPLWDNSAMDGYAVRANDLSEGPPEHLSVVDVIAAGDTHNTEIQPGECARIFTGAPIPPGADAVLIQENAIRTGDRMQPQSGIKQGQNIRMAGEEFDAGDTVLHQGQRLDSGAMGLCAAIGLTHVPVYRLPRVGILSTGDEIQAPGAPLKAGQIWSSNSAALTGLVIEAGGLPIDLGTVGDSKEQLIQAFQQAQTLGLDLLLTTGGVSVGDYDQVKQALTASGMAMDFWKIRMKPGKPLSFGHLDDMAVFGLPGNPVSCMVGFLQFVRPLIRVSLQDSHPFLPVVRARFIDQWRRRPGRAEFLRVILEWTDSGIEARLSGSQSQAWCHMSKAHGLALISPAATHLKSDDMIDVQLFCPGHLGQAHPGYRWGGRVH